MSEPTDLDVAMYQIREACKRGAKKLYQHHAKALLADIERTRAENERLRKALEKVFTKYSCWTTLDHCQGCAGHLAKEALSSGSKSEGKA